MDTPLISQPCPYGLEGPAHQIMDAPRYPYSVGAVANYMIGRAVRRAQPISYRRLEKLLYLSYCAFHAIPGRKRRLFREGFEAWPWGPVVPAVYHEFKRFGPAPIRKWSTDYHYLDGEFDSPVVSDYDRRALIALDFSWKRYLREPLDMLRHLTQSPGTPWHRAWSLRRGARPKISEKAILNHSHHLFHDIFNRSSTDESRPKNRAIF